MWFRGEADMPTGATTVVPAPGVAQPNNTAFALDLASMNKGVAYVNGFNIGRYSVEPGEGDCSGESCAPPHHGSHCYMHYKDCGKPTQTLYHIPFSVLRPHGNVIVLFEETAQFQSRDLAAVAIVALHGHPKHD